MSRFLRNNWRVLVLWIVIPLVLLLILLGIVALVRGGGEFNPYDIY